MSVWARKWWAIARIRFADGPRRAGRHELNHDIHQGFRRAFISDHVHVAGWLEEGLPSRNHLRCAGGVLSLVEARGARFDHHKAQAWMAVPAEPAAGLNRDLYNVEVRDSRGLDLCFPVVNFGIGVDVSEVAQIRGSKPRGIGLVKLRDRGTIRDVHAPPGCCERWHDYQRGDDDERQCDERVSCGRLFSYGKPDISAAEATRTGRKEIECSTVPGQSRRSIICGTVEGQAGIHWC